MKRTFFKLVYWLVAGFFPVLAGCYSGRVGGLRLLDNAVLIEDYAYPRLAIVANGKVAQLQGDSFVPMTRSGRWVVAQETVSQFHWVRADTNQADAPRLPLTFRDRKLTAYDLETGETRLIANTLDGDDTQITDLRLDGDRLVAKAATRYASGWKPVEGRFFAYTLPNGPWEPLSNVEGGKVLPRTGWERKFENLRTQDRAKPAGPRPRTPPAANPLTWERVTTFEELKTKGLNRGDWGEIFERQVKNAWEVVFQPPDGGELIVFRQNDGGLTQSNRSFLRASGAPP